MAIFHSKPEYMASNENLGLQWSVESMINTLACLVFPYGQAEIAYFHGENLPRFGMKIFENLILSSNTSNMYIKWDNTVTPGEELSVNTDRFLRNFGPIHTDGRRPEVCID